MKLSTQQAIQYCAEFICFKAKMSSHNTTLKKQKTLNYLILRQNPAHFTSFNAITSLINSLSKSGLESARGFRILVKMLAFYCDRHQGFDPTMSEDEYFSFFHPLTKDLKNSTLNAYAKRLQVFLNYLRDEKDLKISSLSNIKKKFAKEKTLPSFLHANQYQAFLNYVRKMPAATLAQKRNKLTMLIVGYTGMRTREVNHLLLDNISIDHTNAVYLFKIQGKGFKERIVSIKCYLIRDILEEFLQDKKSQGKISPYLTQLRNTNTPICNHINLKPILQELQCVQTRGNYLHLLRHSFGSFVYGKSKDLILTQQVLGHSNLSSTQIYIHLNQEAHAKVAGFFSIV